MEVQTPAALYHCQIKEVADIEKSHQQLDKAGLKESREAVTMAAQEQAAGSIEARISYTRWVPGAGCKMHNKRANLLGRYRYRSVGWKSQGQNRVDLSKVVEKDQVGILWDV